MTNLKQSFSVAFWSALFATSLSITATSAQFAPQSSEPVDITGETLEFNDNIATWTGNVRALQGEAILTSKKLVATLDDAGDFRTITANGDVRYSNGKEIITGRSAVYDAGTRTISVSEDVVVTQGDQVMTGGALVYWVDTGKIRFTAPNGKRIRGLFYTNQATPKS